MVVVSIPNIMYAVGILTRHLKRRSNRVRLSVVYYTLRITYSVRIDFTGVLLKILDGLRVAML